MKYVRADGRGRAARRPAGGLGGRRAGRPKGWAGAWRTSGRAGRAGGGTASEAGERWRSRLYITRVGEQRLANEPTWPLDGAVH